MAAADEVYRLQRGRDAECRFFQAFADRGHYRGKGGTRQGIYAVSPSGRLLGSINSLEADAVLAMLERALGLWQTLSPEERRLSVGTDLRPAHRWEVSRPADGLVLTSINRDLPAALGPEADRSDRWNRDHVWFSAAEARAWLGRQPEVGAVHPLAPSLAARLARFQLVDNVRGQAVPFTPQEVIEAAISTEVLARDGSRATVKITGRTRALSEGAPSGGDNDWTREARYPHGLTAVLLGRADYDFDTMAFTRFELVALGRRWGRTQNNARSRQLEASAIGFYFTLTPSGPEAAVPPAFIDVYNADWVVRPNADSADAAEGGTTP